MLRIARLYSMRSTVTALTERMDGHSVALYTRDSCSAKQTAIAV